MNESNGERMPESMEYLRFGEVKPGDTVLLTTGSDAESWKYTFLVDETEAGWLSGFLSGISPEGDELPSTPFEMHGSGLWTARAQNPVQAQEKALTINYHSVTKGQFLVGKFSDTDDMAVFDNDGQALTDVRLEKTTTVV